MLPGDPPQADPQAPDPEPPPPSLDPESPHYQPWAEKQIFNASKEKRPLEEFLADFSARVEAAGQPAIGGWDPTHNERMLARYLPNPAPGRRRRRRPSGRGQGARSNPGQPRPTPEARETGPTAPERHRRRRGRPRGGRRPGGAAAPS